ncbi:alpha/beta hydrolase [Halosquirtibacter xylanolyticus]|uniref:alpha/beta fold hydrolase n=1 Tax=Halosquirtibacter xylanolyticus TaxID=3374599 RepID=UPI003748CAEA|nr:alpha/beta hydrolase [Prolixibacteraceae bacterium]
MYLNINHRNYCVEVFGEGEVLLLLHGYMESKKAFDPIKEKLALQYKVIAVDLPGHGDAGEITTPFSFDEIAADMMMLLDHLEIEGRVHFAGHSMGGYVGQAMAAFYPNTLKSLNLIHSATWAASKEYQKLKEREKSFVLKGKAGSIARISIPDSFAPKNRERMRPVIDQMIEDAQKMTTDSLVTIIDAMKGRESWYHLVNCYPIPVHIIAGKYDQVAPLEKLQADLPNWRNGHLTILEQSGHHGFIEEPEVFLYQLNQFTTQIDAHWQDRQKVKESTKLDQKEDL